MRTVFLLPLVAASLAVSGCATTRIKPAAGLPTLAQLNDRYAVAKSFAEQMLPYVSPARAARIRLALDLTGIALAELNAKAAVTSADLLAVETAQGGLDVVIDAP